MSTNDLIAQGNNIAQQVARAYPEMSYLRDSQTQIMLPWNPVLRDAQDDVRASWRKAASRAIDSIHNSGWMAGAIDQAVADTMGSELILNAQPNAEQLGWDNEFKNSWSRTVEAAWKQWSNTPDECDMRGRCTIGELTEAAVRWHYAFGESLTLFHQVNRPGSESRLKVYMISPHRLKLETAEHERLLQGVFVDEWGRPLGYRLSQKRNGYDQDVDIKAVDSNGWRQVLHLHSGDVTSHRGITPLAPILRVLRQYDQLSDATLTAALLQTVLAATITSPEFPDELFAAFNGDDDNPTEVDAYMAAKLDWASRTNIDLGQHGKVVSLFPGEKLEMGDVNAPNDNYIDFSKNLLREIARCIGVTYEGMTLDHTSATYSSVRMGVSTIWPMAVKRRKRIAQPFVQSIYNHWLAESIAFGRIPFPGGYDAFRAKALAACAAQWNGPAKPTADDHKSAKASTERLTNGTSSLQIEAAENGHDIETIIEQRAREHEMCKDKGLPSPYDNPKSPGVASEAVEPEQPEGVNA